MLAMNAIPVRVRRLLFLLAIYAVLTIPFALLLELRYALAWAVILLVLVAWVFPTGAPKSPEFRHGSVGSDMGALDHSGAEVDTLEGNDPGENSKS